ncbi:UNKNOWN [Stylonychia lemnae]|uniref:Uncharacterized protein n=1 Tax=Stylonychia lemnae TaxID=5949 RepID=A0A078AJC2_STYLE|nr:UNKNOWN [Stylonychia lemnae]|eukprot:CDW82420.1 UNKNOWN [Stylonychia lemnae]
MLSCKPPDMHIFKSFSVTFWYKQGNTDNFYNIVELKKSFLIYYDKTAEMINFSNQDINNPTDAYLSITKDKWHYMNFPLKIEAYNKISLRSTTYEYKNMLRYFRFDKILNGELIYDYSFQKEHCVNFQSSIWTKDSVVEKILTLNSLTQIAVDTSYENWNLVLNQNGISINPPQRITNYEEGITIEFWFNLKNLPSTSFELILFYLNVPSQGSLYQYMSSATNLQQLFLNYQGYASSFSFSGSVTVQTSNWYYYVITFNPRSKCFTQIIGKGEVNVPRQSNRNCFTSATSPLYNNINMLKFMYVQNCGSDCSSFQSFIQEIKIWDTIRIDNLIWSYSKTIMTKIENPALVGYWRLIYEIQNYGNYVFDYSVNSNDPVDVSSLSWLTPSSLLELCQNDQLLDITIFTCQSYTQQQSSLTAATSQFKFNFQNSTHLLINNVIMGSWEWTADFWMLKNSDTDYATPFYIGEYEYHHNYFDDYQMMPQVMFNIQGCWINTTVYQDCYMKSFNDGRYSTAMTNFYQNCSLENNSTLGCQNLCQYSSNCDNTCDTVHKCKIYCDNAQLCKGSFKNSIDPQFTCQSSSKTCNATFTDNSNNIKLSCSGVQTYCGITIDSSSSNNMAVSGDLSFSIDSILDCQSSNYCEIKSTTTYNQVLDCTSATKCSGNFTDAFVTSSTASDYYNVIIAVSAINPSYTFSNSDRIALNCWKAENCQLFINSPRNLNRDCSYSTQYHKINAQATTGYNFFTLDQSSSVYHNFLAAIDCSSSSSCQNEIKNGPICSTNTKLHIIECDNAVQCINSFTNTHLVSIQCELTKTCTNTIKTSTLQDIGGIYKLYPYIKCKSSDACTTTLTDVDYFQLDCYNTKSCVVKLTGTTSNNEVSGSDTDFKLYSYINCQKSYSCNLDITNGANYVFVDLQNSQTLSSSSSSISFTGTISTNEAFYPVILAQSSQSVQIQIKQTTDAFIDCAYATSCVISLDTIYRSATSLTSPLTYPQILNLTEATSSSVTINNSPAAYINCKKSKTACKGTISLTTTSYNSDTCNSPYTIFNKMDCSESTGKCTMICASTAKFCQLNCQKASNCFSTFTQLADSSYPYVCSLQIFLNYVDCSSPTATCTNTMSQTPFYYVKCENVCTNSLSTVVPVSQSPNGNLNPDYSIYPYINCDYTTATCTNTLANVYEFYINCQTSLKCKNTVSGQSTYSYQVYQDYSVHSMYSIINCEKSKSCENQITSHVPIYINCKQATYCKNTILTTNVVFTFMGFRIYPQIEADYATGQIINIVTTAWGVRILCSAVSTSSCDNTLSTVFDFIIDCKMQNCNNVISTGANSVISDYTTTLETQYSIIKCNGKDGQICSNSATSANQVYIVCNTFKVKCTNTISTANQVPIADSTYNSVNFPYINCNGLQSPGSCTNTISSYNVALIDCEGSINACTSTLSTGPSTQPSFESLISCYNTKKCSGTCTSTQFCIIDCESSSDTCTSKISLSVRSTTLATNTLAYPFVNCYSAKCSGTCDQSTDCLLYGYQSLSGSTYTVNKASST